MKARQLKHSGTKISKKKSWYAEATKLGFNYKIPEMSCALAISQLKNLTNLYKKNIYIKNTYFFFKKYKVNYKFQKISKNLDSSYHMFIFCFIKKFHLKKNYISLIYLEKEKD